MAKQNSNCDGGRCFYTHGEVRVLPHGSNPNHGNSILCRACYRHEILHRRDRNTKLAVDCQYDLPEWDELKVYATDSGAIK